MNITLSIEHHRHGEIPLKTRSFFFSAGEAHVNIVERTELRDAPWCTITANLRNAADIMLLLNMTDAIRRIKDMPIHLRMPYAPYSRQDRVCEPGEALGAAVFAKLINSQNYASVTTLDNHSEVMTALLDRCVNISPCVMLKKVFKQFPDPLEKVRILVSPDAGANKKVLKAAKELGIGEVIHADKVRDTSNGNIVGTVVHPGSLALSGRPVLIVDDIIDGGRTFIELAKALKKDGAGAVYLYATHGIFSQGLEVFNGLIEKIFVANSFILSYDPILGILPQEELFT